MVRQLKTKIVAKKAAAPAPKQEVAEKKAPLSVHVGFAATAARTGKNLSPVVLDRIPNSFTDRDRDFLVSLHNEFGTKSFTRLNFDAGLMSRLIGHGCLEHVGGALDERTAQFKITAKALKERLAQA